MLNSSKNILLLILTIAVITEVSCSSKAYSEDKLKIDARFLNLFNSAVLSDTLCFRNKVGDIKVFVVNNIDSIISNKKGWFINEEPYKLLRMNFRQIGNDTTKLERRNELFVSKSPVTEKNSLCIKFNNFYYFTDNVLPVLNKDTLILNKRKITNYYAFKSSLNLKNANDLEILYMNSTKGFIGFKELNGEVWINCYK